MLKKEEEFYKNLIKGYLKFGSVDEVFKYYRYDLPISYASFQRLLDKWDIVKNPGPNTNFSEILSFLTKLAQENTTINKLYQKTPLSFKTSLKTLHRILHLIKNKLIRRTAAALVITIDNNFDDILIGNDISTPRLEYGKPFGSLSLPMGFSKRFEESELSILRILQKEVFLKETINKNIPDIIPSNPKPFMFLDIADVRVSVFHLPLNKKYWKYKFTSEKLINHTFENFNKIFEEKNKVRSGVIEIVKNFENYSENKKVGEIKLSDLNEKLLYSYAE